MAVATAQDSAAVSKNFTVTPGTRSVRHPHTLFLPACPFVASRLGRIWWQWRDKRDRDPTVDALHVVPLPTAIVPCPGLRVPRSAANRRYG